MAGTCLRILLLDLPLFTVFALYLSTATLIKIHRLYLEPQIELLRWTPQRAANEVTYFHRVCHQNDQTAHDTADLVIDPTNTTVEERVDHMLKHGVSVYPDLLQPTTVTRLRDFVLNQNLLEENFWVIENEHRHSFGIRVNQHPAVQTALEEILSNPTLVPALEGIVGPNPAIIEFTAITSTAGAKTQRYHQDVVPEGSAAKYGRTFVPSYSLFVPLQNTTAAMGATDICPGSHMCADGALDYCAQSGGFQVSGKNDNWPASWGALLNQQTAHRGMAFTDPSGPDRVLFILTFAPRPNINNNSKNNNKNMLLETRTLSTGGSYSMHWSQWGHTLADFAKPARRMAQPWKVLRSLGIYKPADQQWGWDWITTTTMRAVNDEAGYNRHDLDTFIEKGGFWFLPQQLQGQVSGEDETGAVWFDFLLDTVQRCKQAFQKVHVVGLGTYAGGVVLVNGLLWALGRRQSSELTIAPSFRRILVGHCVLTFLSILLSKRVEQTPWARNIRSGKLYSPPALARGELTAPATLALDQDVLVLDDYQSDYLGSYARVHEISHPGNRAWNEIAATHSALFTKLPATMQDQLCESIALWLRQDQHRMLAKNINGEWSELGNDKALQFIHKGLMMRSDPFVKHVVTQIDYLLAETKFGMLRGSSMHLGAIPVFLRSLQDKILRPPFSRSLKPSTIVASWMDTMVSQSALPPFPKTRRSIPLTGRRLMLPSKPDTSEPELGAWLKEGDAVEAKYTKWTTGKIRDCSGNLLVAFKRLHISPPLVCFLAEWYKGTVRSASADRDEWEVEYDDGEAETAICHQCIRPFLPYVVDEAVDWRSDEDDDTFFRGLVVGVGIDDQGEETYDILLDGSDEELVPEVYPSRMRRFEKRYGDIVSVFKMGTRVVAMFNGVEDEWYAGLITRQNRDGTFRINYDDGDMEERVPAEYIMLEE